MCRLPQRRNDGVDEGLQSDLTDDVSVVAPAGR
jgi:hypothetical protein